MKLLIQIGIVFALFWVSQIIEQILPFPFPASVISLLLLLLLLVLRVIKVEQVREKADYLLGNLGFFFVPISASFMNYIDVLRGNVVPFLVICLVSTVLTFAATAWTVVLVRRLMERKGGSAR